MPNRQQRRRTKPNTVTLVKLKDLVPPWQMTDAECSSALQDRTMTNVLQTEHPLHHRTASGVIVSPDPTTEYYLRRLRAGKDESHQKQVEAIERLAAERDQRRDIPPAVRVNRSYYGVDPYVRH